MLGNICHNALVLVFLADEGHGREPMVSGGAFPGLEVETWGKEEMSSAYVGSIELQRASICIKKNTS